MGSAAGSLTSLLDEDEEDGEEENDGRCEYTTSEGIRCRNQARPGSRFCGIHENLD